MYSTLSKIADRNFIIGFFIPALLAAIAWIELFATGDTRATLISKTVPSVKALTDLTIFVVAVWVGGLILSILDVQLTCGL